MFKSINEVLIFAAEKEQSAYEYYTALAARMQDSQTRQLFEHIASQELNHKHIIDKVRRNPGLDTKTIKLDAELLPKQVRSDRKSKLAIQNAIILAIQREESAYDLYTNLFETVDEDDIKKIFQSLAAEEAGHKKHLRKILKKIK